jgi:hypothetical protein
MWSRARDEHEGKNDITMFSSRFYRLAPRIFFLCVNTGIIGIPIEQCCDCDCDQKIGSYVVQ